MATLSDTRLVPAIVDTIEEPLLVLDDSLTVLQANPAFYSLFHAPPDEVQGRNFYELGNRQWDLPELRSLLENVIPSAGRVNGYRVDLEFPSMGRRIMLLNARLIDGADPRPDLILLTISDTTELEEARYELEGQKEYSEKIIDSIREALLVLNWDLQVKHANQPFYEVFKVTPAETEGRLVYEIGNGQWSIPQLRTLLEDILPNQSSFDDFEVEHDFESIGRRTMLLNARRLDHLNLILLAIEDVTEREQSHRRQKILSRELSHRVKNILTLVNVLANQTAAGASSLDQFLGAFHGRIKALARAQGQWLANEWAGGDLRELVLETLDGCAVDHERVHLQGEPVRVTSDQTMALNLSLHELCTNAIKHGALSVSDGRLQVNWSTEEVGGSKQVRLLWKESGGPAVEPPTHKGFGNELIERLCPHELSGEAEVKYEPSGLQCVLVFPLKQP